MAEQPRYRLALLGSPLAVMRAERLLRQEGLAVKAMPVPPSVSTECGICLCFLDEDEARVRALLSGLGMELKATVDA